MAALAALSALASCGAAAEVVVTWPAYKPLAARPGYFSSVGNHRFNMSVPTAEAAVVATAVWRRPDSAPLSKAVYITSAANSSTPIPCSFVGEPSADSATVTFAPVAGSTEYFLYYMPFTTCEYLGGACIYGAQTTYDRTGAAGSCKPAVDGATVSPAELKALAGGSAAAATTATAGLAASYQARAPFETFEPMEQPMTAAELSAFMGRWRSSTGAIVVAEARENVVKMKRQLPHRWAGLTPATASSFAAVVRPGEKFTFQLAVINVGSAAPPPPPPPAPPSHPISPPFCVQQSNSLAFCQKNKEAVCPWYIKTGGDPKAKVGWQSDPGSTDPATKCCRPSVGACYWYESQAACASALHNTTCLSCKSFENDLGCPSWNEPLPSPSPIQPNITAVTFSELRSASASIPAPHCMNTQGSDFWGRNFSVNAVPVHNGTVLPLWVAAAIPATTAAGSYAGTVRLTFNGTTTTVKIVLKVSGAVLPNGGDDEIQRRTRLHWFGESRSPLLPRLLHSVHTLMGAPCAYA
jgi:hypothetical protein